MSAVILSEAKNLVLSAAHRRVLVAALLAAAVAILALPARAADWPAFLGPRQDGSSDETGLDLDWPVLGPPLVWHKTLGPSYSPPVVAGGRLIAFHRMGDDEVVEALDAATGESLWTFRYPTAYKDRYQYNGGPRSSPTINDGRVYTYGAEGVLTCLSLADGAKVWQRALNKDLGVPQNFFGAGVPPVIEGGLILLNAGGPGGAGVVAVRKDAGQTVWTAGDCGASYSTPVLATIRGQRMAIFFTERGLLVLDPADGKVLHQFPFRSPLKESVNAASPVVVGDVVLVSACYGVGSAALRIAPAGLEVVWQNLRNLQCHWATPHYRDGLVWGTHGRHAKEAELRCLDWATGAVKWASPPGAVGRAPLLRVQGHFIGLGETGDLVLIEMNPDRYVEKARVPVLEHPCWAPPVLAGGLLYVRNDVQLVCLDLRPKKAAAAETPSTP